MADWVPAREQCQKPEAFGLGVCCANSRELYVEFWLRQNSQAIRRSRIASPFTLTFGEADRGKRVYFCLRWETNTNLKGPWGEIYSAIIP